MNTETPTVLLAIDDTLGYSPSQVKSTMTLGALLVAVEDAIADFGEDATIVLANGQRYGAGYGALNVSRYGELFSEAVENEDF